MRRALTAALTAGLTARVESRAGAPFADLRALPPAGRVAAGILVVIALAALLAPVLAGDPLATGTPVQPPGGEHPFGTDAIGRDLFSRVVWGARSSLTIGLLATGAALAVAAVLGSLAATCGRVTSEALMRLLDVVMSFPGIALAAVFVAVFGNALPVLVLAIAFLYVPQLSRVVRAGVLEQFGEDYVSASRVMGARTSRILIKHVARNAAAPIVVFATVLVADAIVFEASLSFISAGVEPPHPSWGNILSDGKQLLLSGYWWPTFFPGVLILITVLSLNVLAEGLTDALAYPDGRGPADGERAGEARTVSAVAVPDAGPTLGAGGARTESAVATSDAGPTFGVGDREAADAALARPLALLAQRERERTDRRVYAGDSAPLLSVQGLSIAFPAVHGEVPILDDVSFEVRPGETMGLVGESGCGKSITALAVMGLLPATARVSGRIDFDGRDLLAMGPADLAALRGHEMAMVYQDALSALNPSMRIRSQLGQLLRQGGTRGATELLEMVGLDPARTLASYPHELSGGQRQRVLLAMALTRDPRLILADEPTTALDVTVQRQVVDLLDDLSERLGFAIVFVSHDLALVAQLAMRITVMYAGQVVEQGPTGSLLADPRHEYTRGLLGAVALIEAGASRAYQVPGAVPSPRDYARGDRFAPRSSYTDVGLHERPTLRSVDPGGEHRYASTDALEAARALRSAGGTGGAGGDRGAAGAGGDDDAGREPAS